MTDLIKKNFFIVLSTILIMMNLLIIVNIFWFLYEVYGANYPHAKIADFYSDESSSKLKLIKWIKHVLACFILHPLTIATFKGFYDWTSINFAVLDIVYLYYYFRNAIFIKQAKIRYLFWILIGYIAIFFWLHLLNDKYSYFSGIIKSELNLDVDTVLISITCLYVVTLGIILIKIIKKN